MKIEFQNLSKQFEDGKPVLKPTDFSDDVHALAIIAFWGRKVYAAAHNRRTDCTDDRCSACRRGSGRCKRGFTASIPQKIRVCLSAGRPVPAYERNGKYCSALRAGAWIFT